MTRSEIRQRAEDLIEQLIALVDQIDGDPDAEIETDFDVNPFSLQRVDQFRQSASPCGGRHETFMGHRMRTRSMDNSLVGERVSAATYSHLGIPVALVASGLCLDLHRHSYRLGMV